MLVFLNHGGDRFARGGVARFTDSLDPLPPVTGALSSKPIALIASDEDMVTTRLKSMISGIGYNVMEAKNSSEARKILDSYKVALIFSNIGVRGLIELTSEESSKGIPLVVMSKSDINDIKRIDLLKDVEITAFIKKPLTANDFMAAMDIADGVLHPPT